MTLSENQHGLRVAQKRLDDAFKGFYKIEDIGFDLEQEEEPSDALYDLNDLASDLTALSEGFDKMKITEADETDDAQLLEVAVTLRDSDAMIKSMIKAKRDEVLKVSELIEKFHQLRRDQEFQLGNAIRAVKEESGLKALEATVLDRELQVNRLRTECSQKEEIQKLILSGRDTTEAVLRETYEKFELEAIASMNSALKATNRELASKNLELKEFQREADIWRDKLQSIMKSTEASEIESLRQLKEKLHVSLAEANDEYNDVFRNNSQQLKMLTIVEKRRQENESFLEKSAVSKEAKLLNMLEAKANELQESVVLGKLRAEELESFIGQLETQRHLDAMPAPATPGSSAGNNGASERRSGTSAEPTTSSAAADEPADSAAGPPSPMLIPRVREVAAIKEVRRLAASLLEPQSLSPSEARQPQQTPTSPTRRASLSSSSSPGRTARSGSVLPPAGAKVDLQLSWNGLFTVPERLGFGRAQDLVKAVCDDMVIPDLPREDKVSAEEQREMQRKEDQLDEYVAGTEDCEGDAAPFRSAIEGAVTRRGLLKDMTVAELSASAHYNRELLTQTADEISRDEAILEELRFSVSVHAKKWEYLTEKLAEEVVDRMLVEKRVLSESEIPVEIHSLSIWAKIKGMRRMAQKWRDRVAKAKMGDVDDVLKENAREINGNIDEFEGNEPVGAALDAASVSSSGDSSDYSNSDDDETKGTAAAGGELSGSVHATRGQPRYYYGSSRKYNIRASIRKKSIIDNMNARFADEDVMTDTLSEFQTHILKSIKESARKFMQYGHSKIAPAPKVLLNLEPERVKAGGAGRKSMIAREVKRSSRVLSMTGRNKLREARAAAAAETQITGRRQMLHRQLQAGLDGDYGGLHAGSYHHSSRMGPTSGIADILSLISSPGSHVEESNEDDAVTKEDESVDELIDMISAKMRMDVPQVLSRRPTLRGEEGGEAVYDMLAAGDELDSEERRTDNANDGDGLSDGGSSSFGTSSTAPSEGFGHRAGKFKHRSSRQAAAEGGGEALAAVQYSPIRVYRREPAKVRGTRTSIVQIGIQEEHDISSERRRYSESDSRGVPSSTAGLSESPAAAELAPRVPAVQPVFSVPQVYSADQATRKLRGSSLHVSARAASTAPSLDPPPPPGGGGDMVILPQKAYRAVKADRSPRPPLGAEPSAQKESAAPVSLPPRPARAAPEGPAESFINQAHHRKKHQKKPAAGASEERRAATVPLRPLTENDAEEDQWAQQQQQQAPPTKRAYDGREAVRIPLPKQVQFTRWAEASDISEEVLESINSSEVGEVSPATIGAHDASAAREAIGEMPQRSSKSNRTKARTGGVAADASTPQRDTSESEENLNPPKIPITGPVVAPKGYGSQSVEESTYDSVTEPISEHTRTDLSVANAVSANSDVNAHTDNLSSNKVPHKPIFVKPSTGPNPMRLKAVKGPVPLDLIQQNTSSDSISPPLHDLHRALDDVLKSVEERGRKMKELPMVSIIDWQSGDAIDIDSWNRYWGISDGNRVVPDRNVTKKKERATPNIQLTSALAGYADYAGTFDWERSIRMNREVVQDIVNHLRIGRGEPVAAYLPPKSVEAHAENNVRPESISDLLAECSNADQKHSREYEARHVKSINEDNSFETGNLIRIPTKIKARKQASKPFYEVVVNTDGNSTFIFRR
jgi:hypothetical protein